MSRESRNPFYFLLLVVSFLFVLTVLAYAVVPMERQPEWLEVHGWKILLGELAAVIVLGLLSMGLDRVRSLRKQAGSGTMQAKE